MPNPYPVKSSWVGPQCIICIDGTLSHRLLIRGFYRLSDSHSVESTLWPAHEAFADLIASCDIARSALDLATGVGISLFSLKLLESVSLLLALGFHIDVTMGNVMTVSTACQFGYTTATCHVMYVY